MKPHPPVETVTGFPVVFAFDGEPVAQGETGPDVADIEPTRALFKLPFSVKTPAEPESVTCCIGETVVTLERIRSGRYSARFQLKTETLIARAWCNVSRLGATRWACTLGVEPLALRGGAA